MIWQDIVLATVNVVFVAALLPSVIGIQPKPPALMSWLTGSALLICAGTQATIELKGTALVTSLLAGMWIYMAVRSSMPAFKGGAGMIVFEWRELRYHLNGIARCFQWRK